MICVNLLKWKYRIWYSNYNQSQYLIEFLIVNHHLDDPSVLCNGQLRELKDDVVGTTTFQVLDGVINFFNSSRDMILFWFTIFFGRGKCFHSAFPNIIALTPQVREPMWEVCQLLSISIPVTHSRTGKITTDRCWEPSRPTVNWSSAKIPWNIFTTVAPTLTGGPQFGLAWDLLESESTQYRSQKVWLFPFPECTVTLVKKQTNKQ